MPKLWNETIEAHRRDVQAAVIDATAALIAEQGLLSVTMSRIAQDSGIGRATLYKYFPDVDSILDLWHERQVASHLQHLVRVRDHASGTADRLRAVLEAYALMVYETARHHDTGIATVIHRPQRMAEPDLQLHHMIQELIADPASSPATLVDVPADELATFCLNALASSPGLSSKDAVRRLVTVTLNGLRA